MATQSPTDLLLLTFTMAIPQGHQVIDRTAVGIYLTLQFMMSLNWIQFHVRFGALNGTPTQKVFSWNTFTNGKYHLGLLKKNIF